jgi:pimeloyl-ACP methyl ester carboxylesterase
MATFKAKDGTQIYFKDCGAGKPVLFSHGWPLDGDMWDSQLNYLASAASAPSPLTVAALAARISRGTATTTTPLRPTSTT